MRDLSFFSHKSKSYIPMQHFDLNIQKWNEKEREKERRELKLKSQSPNGTFYTIRIWMEKIDPNKTNEKQFVFFTLMSLIIIIFSTSKYIGHCLLKGGKYTHFFFDAIHYSLYFFFALVFLNRPHTNRLNDFFTNSAHRKIIIK